LAGALTCYRLHAETSSINRARVNQARAPQRSSIRTHAPRRIDLPRRHAPVLPECALACSDATFDHPAPPLNLKTLGSVAGFRGLVGSTFGDALAQGRNDGRVRD
jgi:hypothetical protein